MKNKKFFYQQYDTIEWKNQEKTKLNAFINDYLADRIVSEVKSSRIRLFDIGFGIGFFFRQILPKLQAMFSDIELAGCEPSVKNFTHFSESGVSSTSKKVSLNMINSPFLESETKGKFDVVTAIYVFPHIISDEVDAVAKRIHDMLDDRGRFFLVLANGDYLKEKLATQRDLFIEENVIEYRGKQYKEFLHYSNIPEIGKVIDYNRDEAFYEDVFTSNGFTVADKAILNDYGFVCTVFTFQKQA